MAAYQVVLSNGEMAEFARISAALHHALDFTQGPRMAKYEVASRMTHEPVRAVWRLSAAAHSREPAGMAVAGLRLAAAINKKLRGNHAA